MKARTFNFFLTLAVAATIYTVEPLMYKFG